MRLPVLPCICHRSTSLKLETDCISRRLIMERARAVMYTLYGFTSHLPNAPCREFMPTQKPLVDPHATNLMLFSLVVQCKASLYIQWIHQDLVLSSIMYLEAIVWLWLKRIVYCQLHNRLKSDVRKESDEHYLCGALAIGAAFMFLVQGQKAYRSEAPQAPRSRRPRHRGGRVWGRVSPQPADQ